MFFSKRTVTIFDYVFEYSRCGAACAIFQKCDVDVDVDVVSQSVGQSVSQAVSRSVSQSGGQSVSQSVSQPAPMAPQVAMPRMVPRGLEPRTLRLLAERSNQLSYGAEAKF